MSQVNSSEAASSILWLPTTDLQPKQEKKNEGTVKYQHQQLQ